MLEIRAHAGGRLLALALSIALLGWAGAATAARPDTDPVMSVFDDEEEYEDDGGGEEDYEDDGEEGDEGEEEEEASEEEEENTEEVLDEADEGEEGDEGDEGEEPADDDSDDSDADEELESADDADEEAGTDDADAESDAEDAESDWSEEELEALQDDNDDDSWADVWEFDESDQADDAIPADDNYDDDMVWEVVEVVTTAEDDDEGAADEDSVGTGAMLSVRSGKARTKPAGRPATPRPAKPGRPEDDEDTVYAYGGRPVSALSVPWQAQIFYPSAPPKANDKRAPWQRQHYCGGALIAPDWVVTAAHCIDQQMVDLGFKVRLGTLDLSRGDGTVYRIDRIVRHSQYDPENNNVARPPNMYANDIALVRIAADGRPVVRDPKRIREIPINRRPLPAGVPVSATGWGVTGTENADAINAVMLRVDLQLMDIPVCQQRPGYGPQKIHTNVFCASHPTRSTCRGDSGGPVVLTNGAPTLVGIVSWGKRKCAGDGRPGVYTRVDRYADWIDNAMKLPAGRNAYP